MHAPGGSPSVVPIITLTTDFGLRDAYVAEMKGAILGVIPRVQLVDVTHDIAAHDVTEAALALEAAAPWFPRGTIHVAVVDPGVGTARRGLVVEASGQRFVGPDNGLFTPFLAGEGWQAFELLASAYRPVRVSATFHGRDVFAPAAAHLALGVAGEAFGPPIRDPVRLRWPSPRVRPDGIRGEIVHVDRFGNLVSSVPAALVPAGGRVAVRIARHWLPIVGTYGDLRRGQAGALIGSGNRLEVAVREGSAAHRFRARRGTAVLVTARE